MIAAFARFARVLRGVHVNGPAAADPYLQAARRSAAFLRESMWNAWAVALQQRQDELFWDDAAGGWFSTTGEDPSVLLRMKDDSDGAEPTASAVSVLNLIVLSHLIEDAQWPDRIERTLRLFGSRLEQAGRAVPMMAAAVSTYLAGVQQIV